MIGDIYRLFFFNLFGLRRRSSRKEFINRFIMMWFLPGYVFLYMDEVDGMNFTPSFLNSILSVFALALQDFIFLLLFVIGMCLLLQLFFLIHRRIHDLGFRGWWQLLIFSPISPFFILVLMVIKGEEGKNKYGDPPKF